MFPSAGAYYTVARRAFGDYISFVVGWTDCVSLCAAIATITILAGEYLGDLLPRFANHKDGWTDLVARLYSYRNATIGSTFVARRAGR
jgi:amino acid transporter